MNNPINIRHLAGVAVALVAAAGINAQIQPFAEDFESLDQTSATALESAGWLVGANVFDSTGVAFQYNYFTFPAPNGSGAFSNVVNDNQGGVNQGAQQLVVFSDYNNADHTNGSGNRIEANVFREWTVDAGDTGVWTFTFDAKQGDIAGATTAVAFIKVLDPNNGFAASDLITVDTTSLGEGWQEGIALSVDLDASQVGHIFQVGFWNVASNEEMSGVFYDNIGLARSGDQCSPDADLNGDTFVDFFDIADIANVLDVCDE